MPGQPELNPVWFTGNKNPLSVNYSLGGFLYGKQRSKAQAVFNRAQRNNT